MKKIDHLFVSLVFLLVILGLIALTSASSELGQVRFQDSYFYLKHQLIFGLSLGFLGFLIATKINYHYWHKISFFILLFNILLLILTLTPLGVSSGGASRWLRIGKISFQPGETIKFTYLIYLAAWLTEKNRTKKFSKGFLPFTIITALIIVLLLAQPSTSTALIVLMTGLAVYFLRGASSKFILETILLGVVGFGLVIYFTPYRLQRIIAFLYPQIDPQGSSYHLSQSLLAIREGGLFGVGLSKLSSKIYYLPEQIGDSIFSVIAHEAGFIGATLIIFLFLMLVQRCLWIGKKARDVFGKLLSSGFGLLVGIQAFIHIACNSGIIPYTGLPLPFISYGGTAMVSFLTISGIITNISKHIKS